MLLHGHFYICRSDTLQMMADFIRVVLARLTVPGEAANPPGRRKCGKPQLVPALLGHSRLRAAPLPAHVCALLRADPTRYPPRQSSFPLKCRVVGRLK